MKIITAIIFLCITQTCIAQKMLVPYRSGKFFGLSNETGKIIIQPAYEQVKWMTGTWFETSRKIELKDTLETAPQKFYIRNNTAKLSGLINNDKVVLSNEPFDAYEIVADKCIVAKYEGKASDLTKEQYKKYGDKRMLFSLFNLQGKNMYPDNFKSIRKIDTTGISSKNKSTGRYILFWVVNFNNRNSLLVFDADKQEISDWPVKDAFKIEPDRYRTTPGKLLIAVTDSNMNYSVQLLDYSGGTFVLQPTTATVNDTKRRREDNTQKIETFSGSGSGAGPGDYAGGTVVAEPGGESQEQRRPKPVPAFNPYHTFIKDSLVYITSYENRTTVKLPANAKIIRMVPHAMTQYQPVIVIADNRFYIVKDVHLSETSYDSLIYFGRDFLAWKKVSGKAKAGVINENDSVIIPFQYDSLYAGIRYLELVDKNPAANTPDYHIVFKEADSKYSRDKVNPYNRTYTNLLTVFKKGKCGIINIKGDVVIPFNYEMIAKNSMAHMRPREDEFIILKSSNLYGVTTVQYNREKKQDVMNSNTIEPVFDYLLGFFYTNYFGIKGYKLVGLYSEQNNFMGYASENGKAFYDNF